METYQDRYTYLDNIRTILVCLVVFVHIISMFAYPLTFSRPIIDKNCSSRINETLLATFDVFLMPHLIFISAFFIFFSLKNKTTQEYIKKRFFRLFIPIIVFAFCAGDIYYQILFNRLGMPNPTYLSTFIDYWRDFIDFGAITFIREGKMLNQISFNICHTWFLSFLFFMTLIVVLLTISFRNNEKIQEKIDSSKKIIIKTIVLSLILGILYVLITILFHVKGIQFNSWIRVFALVQVGLGQFFMLLPLFLFGLYVYRKEWLTRGDIGDWKIWGSLSVALISIYAMLYNNSIFPVLDEALKINEHNLIFSEKMPPPVFTDFYKMTVLFNFLLKIPICIFLLMFFLTFFKKYLNKPNKLTVFCSKHSINVYILHYIPVLILQYSFVDIPVAPIIKTITMLVIVIPSCLWLSYRFVYPYPVAAICFFVLVKLVALFAGFDFYYIALLVILLISFAGALFASMRLLMVEQTRPQLNNP